MELETGVLRRRVEGCDTFVVLPSHTSLGYTIFGKNSDRPGAEVQEVEYLPPQDHDEGAVLQCTYVEIPQVRHTYGVMLSKPSWMWGGEMGANEHGVVVGNEAVWTKLNNPKDDLVERLLGMDLLRLGLERGKTAKEALEVIGNLLEKHGQGGPCCEDNPSFTYHNSFLIADSSEAWILETAGNSWAATHITDGFRNISNNLTIETKVDLKSEDLEQVAKDKGYWDGNEPFNFGISFSDSGETCDQSRQTEGQKLLEKFAGKGKFEVSDMMSILRDIPSGICMQRDGFGSVSTSSQVSIIPPASSNLQPIHFFTGTPDPSVSVFKPFVFSGESSVGSRYLLSPKYDQQLDPAKKPRFEYKVDRRHPLYVGQQMALEGRHPKKSWAEVSEEVRTMEMQCMNDVLDLLRNKQPLQDVSTLFHDCAESEHTIYRH